MTQVPLLPVTEEISVLRARTVTELFDAFEASITDRFSELAKDYRKANEQLEQLEKKSDRGELFDPELATYQGTYRRHRELARHRALELLQLAAALQEIARDRYAQVWRFSGLLSRKSEVE